MARSFLAFIVIALARRVVSLVSAAGVAVDATVIANWLPTILVLAAALASLTLARMRQNTKPTSASIVFIQVIVTVDGSMDRFKKEFLMVAVFYRMDLPGENTGAERLLNIPEYQVVQNWLDVKGVYEWRILLREPERLKR